MFRIQSSRFCCHAGLRSISRNYMSHRSTPVITKQIQKRQTLLQFKRHESSSGQGPSFRIPKTLILLGGIGGTLVVLYTYDPDNFIKQTEEAKKYVMDYVGPYIESKPVATTPDQPINKKLAKIESTVKSDNPTPDKVSTQPIQPIEKKEPSVMKVVPKIEEKVEEKREEKNNAEEIRLEKEKQKEAVEKRIQQKQAEEASENSRLELNIGNLLDQNKNLTELAVEAQKKVIEFTRSHTDALKKAMDDVNQILNKDEQWQEVADIYRLKEEAVKEAERLTANARENLNQLKAAIDEAKQNAVIKKNKILKTGHESLNKFNHEISSVLSQVTKAESDAKVMSKYKDLIDKGRKQFQAELESIMPEVRLGDKKGKKLTEDELNSLIAHAHRRIDQLQKQLAEQLAMESQRIEKALEIQRREDDKIASSRIEVERQRLRDKFILEKERWDEDARVEFEQELRQHLARQAAAHSDHLKDVLKIQEGEISQQFEREMHTKLIEERQSFQSEVAGWIARLKGIESAVEARAENEKTARTAQELWLACIAMNGILQLGKEGGDTWEEKLQPLAKETTAISEASGKHPFVLAVLETLPPVALSRGVYTEESLKERFPKVKRVCKRVAMIDENGGTLFRYFLSYVQSFFIFNSVYAKTENHTIDINDLDTFNILAHADYFLERGDLLQAVRLMNQLQGEPRRVASDWIKEAMLLLETRQAAYALTSFASASGLGTIF